MLLDFGLVVPDPLLRTLLVFRFRRKPYERNNRFLCVEIGGKLLTSSALSVPANRHQPKKFTTTTSTTRVFFLLFVLPFNNKFIPCCDSGRSKLYARDGTHRLCVTYWRIGIPGCGGPRTAPTPGG
jgi:hypothetical protein